MNLKMYFETHQPGQIDIIHAPNTDIQSCLEWYPISNTCLYKGPKIWLCNSLFVVRSISNTCFQTFSDKIKQPLCAEISILLNRATGHEVEDSRLWCSTHKIDGMLQIKPRQDRQFTADPKATLVKIISAYKANLIYREGKLSKYKSLEVKIVALLGRI